MHRVIESNQQKWIDKWENIIPEDVFEKKARIVADIFPKQGIVKNDSEYDNDAGAIFGDLEIFFPRNMLQFEGINPIEAMTIIDVDCVYSDILYEYTSHCDGENPEYLDNQKMKYTKRDGVWGVLISIDYRATPYQDEPQFDTHDEHDQYHECGRWSR